MSSKTKIIVLHMKEIIYTVIFAIFAILIIGLLFSMFFPKTKRTSTDDLYTPGVYSSAVTLNDTPLTIEVAVDSAKITSIRISNMNEEVDTLYPLLQPTIEELSTQICLSQSLEDLSVSENNSYTASLLLDAISKALEKAAVP